MTLRRTAIKRTEWRRKATVSRTPVPGARTPMKTSTKKGTLARKTWIGAGKPRKPLPQFNAKRQARRQKAYRARLARADWQVLRQAAFDRDGGLCQCERCVKHRAGGGEPEDTRVDTWFDTQGRIHGFDCHHTTYARFGAELLEDLLTMKPKCHRWTERKYGYRRQFLASQLPT